MDCPYRGVKGGNSGGRAAASFSVCRDIDQFGNPGERDEFKFLVYYSVRPVSAVGENSVDLSRLSFIRYLSGKWSKKQLIQGKEQ